MGFVYEVSEKPSNNALFVILDLCIFITFLSKAYLFFVYSYACHIYNNILNNV